MEDSVVIMETERLAVHAKVVIRASIVRKVSSSCSTDRFLLSLNALMTIYNSYFKTISIRPVKALWDKYV